MKFSRLWMVAALAGVAALLVVSDASAQRGAEQPAGAARQRPAAQPPAAAPAPRGQRGAAARNQQQQQQAAQQAPQGLSTIARQAIILDFASGRVMYEKNADEKMPPSSMSKIMTGYLVYKAIHENRVKLDDMLPVSERAWRMGGSKMFVALNSRVKVEDLIRGMVIQSGNDACIVLAEGLAGSEQEFAEQMNREAERLGMTNSHFVNSTGWPDPDHYMTARDLSIIAARLIREFPQEYKYYSELSFTYGVDEKGRPIKQGNRNPLLYKNLGADGFKTGHTEDAGYGLVASAVREGRRVLMVLNGLPSIKARSEESERLLDWAFREYGSYALFKAGAQVERADVWLGDKPTVGLVAASDIVVTMPRKLRPQMKVSVVYDGPIPAPIAQGTQVGKLVVSAPGIDNMETPLVAAESIGRLGIGGRMAASVGYLLFGSGTKK